MAFTWPEFATKQALDGAAEEPGITPLRGWTATFDSYDQYREDCYYRVTLLDGDRPVWEMMVKVGLEFAPGDDWSGPAFTAELRRRIADVAATGKTNTPYGG
jgi:hypothetical protein